MTPAYLLSDLLCGTLAAFAAGSALGFFSKRAAYLLGIAGSALGTVLSLVTLTSGGTAVIDLWQVAPSSSAQLQVSQFNSFFLLVSSLVWLGTCLYSVRYDDDYPSSLSSLLLLTILSMLFVLVSGDAITFLLGWESMTIASFFMILQGKGDREGVRNAAYLFLAFGEGSSVFIMLAFSGLFSAAGTFTFMGPTIARIISPLGSWVFVTALVGFGLKMGLAPFHMSEWLPIAHSSAPSNASALLSATLTLMGVYGIIDVVSHLGQYQLWWGWLALSIGGISALLGALFSSVSEHSKGLPAYSTIENNGMIVVAIGAYIVASCYNLALLADFALIAALFHAFSHSISKASLFLSNGWVSKLRGSFDLSSANPIPADGRRSLGFTGIFTVLSLAAVPPLAGFVSEWMILETLFQSYRFGDLTSQIVGTLVGAVVALAAGMIVVTMTKVYGFGILWPRRSAAKGEKGGFSIVGGLAYFAALIVAIGVAAPAIFLLASNAASQTLGTNPFGTFVTGLLGVPAPFVILSGSPFGGFSPTFTALAFLSILAVVLAGAGAFHVRPLRFGLRARKTQGWFAGSAQADDPSTMYNSFGYSTPIRIMLKFLFRTRESVVQVGSVQRSVIRSPEEYVVDLEVLDVFKKFYDVLAKWTLGFSAYTSRKVMPGKLGLYVVYIMVALIFVLIYILLTVS
ncbi:MAG TPA: proton-conducting transporter membrane subunit [Nitrososphaerales archaeon]|nr:proton-conducting transporter membrane subunit [Nitrososphaerales archaeon]